MSLIDNEGKGMLVGKKGRISRIAFTALMRYFPISLQGTPSKGREKSRLPSSSRGTTTVA